VFYTPEFSTDSSGVAENSRIAVPEDYEDNEKSKEIKSAQKSTTRVLVNILNLDECGYMDLFIRNRSGNMQTTSIKPGQAIKRYVCSVVVTVLVQTIPISFLS
jgi:predicted RNA-binding protein with RPS1 domain